ncbi:Helicase SKI2W [Frankliniella fusca]|uniref:Helicase SKI2W n=1 Tax=Frankliniella fusca TaxID=407009 RepID=A0AAE1LQM2_9NEOP|nr:Helicase SKI2W [Frankliniella fusca]
MPLQDISAHLPFGPPPVLPLVDKQLKEFILSPEDLPIHDYRFTQQHWDRNPEPYTLLNVESAPLGTTLKVRRDLAVGEIIDFVEVSCDDSTEASKAISEAREPLWAGQFLESEDLFLQASTQNLNLNLDEDLSSIPPGFHRGVEFDADGFTSLGLETRKETAIQNESNSSRVSDHAVESDKVPSTLINLMDLVEKEQELLSEYMPSKVEGKTEANDLEVDSANEAEQDNDVIPKEVPVLKIKDTVPLKHNKFQWAEILDVSQPVSDFHERVPNLAHKYEFELDIFQKQAVIKLEERCDVFVAAHTSAGKTVVAEYAIALSMKHMTKAIYTSPIKALSNQKYRDFRHTFGDVGLITGDWKINETASCLIMTTEILRSMLYCRSDVVPDLEYVIFDEVHYINDSDRGHVWEEVLIMLPPSVSIVMLSATVPNTLEFAQWVGRTRQKKVFVITTPKRPVPLEHYLYTGTGGSSKDDRFLIMDGQENFSLEGYRKAEMSREKKPSSKPAPQGRAPPQRQHNWNYKQEKTMWVALIDHLRKREELPVVAFTLSRNRCDNNAEELRSLDLTAGTEKAKIDGFIHKCVQQLQDADKDLPQVLRMKDLLRRGIGVHHSGILPILKEIVEMLFQDGLVKLLFATETFAMGVNMPTRSVIFDSIRKYDGVEWRHLYPGEYIQMAGRAGRRGKDRVGNVLILCKGDIPKEVDLRNMMKGKPTALQSKFRLTYKMMLNLLRRENLKVEEMMSRSFKESNVQEAKDKILSELRMVEEEIKRKGELSSSSPHSQQLITFCQKSLDFLQDWNQIQQTVMERCSAKYLTTGRVVLVTHQQHCNKIGVILMCEIVKREQVYRVLVLCDANDKAGESPLTEKESEECDEVNKLMSFAWPQKYFVPEGSGGHTLIQVKGKDILEVSNQILEVKNITYIKQDWEKRQMPRFRDAPVGQMCAQLVQDLSQLMHSVVAGDNVLYWLNPVQDMKVNDINLAPEIRRLDIIRQELSTDPCTSFANLQDEVRDIYSYLKLQQKKKSLKYTISYQSMTLYPDYLNRLNVLKRLRYIDDHDTVELKGKVACEMSSHELMITELVMEGVLTNLPTAEIAALLSCLVFQHKTDVEQTLTKSLEQGIEEIQRIHKRIEDVERAFKVGVEDPSCESENQLNFNLVQVVYEWAKAKPFAEIMQLTDIQEGIIVRCIQQLHETLQDVKRAARIYGDPKLSNKMDEASNAIKRDIVFSLCGKKDFFQLWMLLSAEQISKHYFSLESEIIPVSDPTPMEGVRRVSWSSNPRPRTQEAQVFVKLSVPEGMDAALQGLTREVLRHQPADIYWFAAQYFENLIRLRGGHVEEIITHHQLKKSTSTIQMEQTNSSKLSGSVASLAATTGTVAVITTASASQPSAPPFEETSWVEEHTISQSHLSKTTSQSEESQVLSGNRSSVHEITSLSSEEASLHENNASSKSLKGKSEKKHSRKTKGKGSKSASVTSGTDQHIPTKGSKAKNEKYGEIENQVSSIVKEIAHDTVLKTEEISKAASTVEKTFQSVEGNGKQEGEPLSNNGSSKRNTRRLRRQTKSVDSSSDKSESGDKTQLHSTLTEAVMNVRNEATAVSVTTEESKENIVSHVMTESSERRDLNSIRDDMRVHNDYKLNSVAQDSQMNQISEPLQREIAQNLVYMTSDHENGQSTSDTKEEELRIQTEGSVRKSSKHDISEEKCDDGTHKKVEEKAEETQEEKREASEKTILERKSNVQVDENGDIVEEEITITRTEQSLTHETTVSKSWTMETTIETLADGETRVIERMIIHSPPLDSTNGLIQETNDQGASSNVQYESKEVNDLTNSVASNNIETNTTLELGDSAPSSNSVEMNSAAKISSLLEDSISKSENDVTKDFGVVIAEDAKKSLDQIGVALEIANSSLSSPHANQGTGISNEHHTHEYVETAERNFNKDSSEMVTLADRTTKKEFGLINVDEVHKSLKHITHTLSEVEQSLELSKTHQVADESSADHDVEVGEHSNVLLAASETTVHPELASTGQEAGPLEESGPMRISKTDSILSLGEGGTHSLEAHALVPDTAFSMQVHSSEAKDATELKPQTEQIINHSDNSVKIVSSVHTAEENKEQVEVSRVTSISELSSDNRESVDENGKPQSLSRLENSGSLQEETLESRAITLEGKAEINSLADETDTDKGSDLSKEGSKEESSSELKGVSFHAHDYPTDEDQATPRDDVESLRIDTPEDNFSVKTSSGSDENGDPINPPTVVISRTADVIELKDSEINIVTQMEKEGLVSEGVSSTFDGPVEQIITRGALQTLADAVPDIDQNSKLSPKIAGITIVAASTIGLIAAESTEPHTECLILENPEHMDDTVEIVAADFDSNQFIQEEIKHSTWLLQGSNNADQTSQHDAREADINELIRPPPLLERSESSQESTSYCKVQNDPEEMKSKSEDKIASSTKTDIEKRRTLTVATSPSKDTLLQESDGLEVEDDGKPIPVDENGKPLYTVRKSRSLQSETVPSVANDIIPDKSKIKLSRTGSLLGVEGENNHWYGSQMSTAGSTLIKPALAMSRDPALESLQPCNEPECIAVDVRAKDKSDSASKVEDESKHSQGRGINESFIISEDAVYIPLNPTIGKPALERIDSMPSVSGQDDIVAESENANALDQLNNKTDSALRDEVIHENESSSPRTYTVTEPMSASDFNEQLIGGEVSEANQDDDVLIVEYPTDPLAKVTKWENVVVASPAEIKDEIFVKDEVQRFESIPNEAQSYMSVDDSLQEVPSLQDEAVNIESESEVLDSMPEEEAERKWTDDIAMAANKAKDVVKGIFSRGNSVQHEASTDDGKHALKSDGKDTAREDALSATADGRYSKEIITENGNEIIETKSNNDMVANHVENHSRESNEINITPKIIDTASKELSHIASDIKHNKEEIEDTVNLRDAVSYTTEALGKEVHKATRTVKTAIVEAKDNVLQAFQDAKDSTVSALESIDNKANRAISEIDSVKLKTAEVTSAASAIATETKNSAIAALATGTTLATDVVDTMKEKASDTAQVLRDVPKFGAEVATGSASEAIGSLEHLEAEVGNIMGHFVTTTAQGTQANATELCAEASRAEEKTEKTAEQLDLNVETTIVQTEESILSGMKSQHEEKTETHETSNSPVALTGVTGEAVSETLAGIASTETNIKDDVKGRTLEEMQTASLSIDDRKSAAPSISEDASHNIHTVVENVDLQREISLENTHPQGKDRSRIQVRIDTDPIDMGKLKHVNPDIPSADAEHVKSEGEAPVEFKRISATKSEAAVEDVNDTRDLTTGSSLTTNENITEQSRADVNSHNNDRPSQTLPDAKQRIRSLDSEVPDSLMHEVREQAENAIQTTLEKSNREKSVLDEFLAHSTNASEIAIVSKMKEAESETVAALEMAEASVKKALDHAELTISSEAQKTLLLVEQTTMNNIQVHSGESSEQLQRMSKEHAEEPIGASIDETVEALEIADKSIKDALGHAEDIISNESRKTSALLADGILLLSKQGDGENLKLEYETEKAEKTVQHKSDLDSTVSVLELTKKSVHGAIDRAEETILSEVRKSEHERYEVSESSLSKAAKSEKQSKIPVPVASTQDQKIASEARNETIENSHDPTLSNLRQSEESVQIALDHAENVISIQTSVHKQENAGEEKSTFSSLDSGTKNEGDIKNTVSTVSLAHQLSEGIHDRVRREVSSLSDASQASPRGRDVENASVRRGRATSDITARKAPSKSDSWESNLRRSTVASSGKIARHANSNGSEPVRHKTPYTTRSVKKAPSPVDTGHKTSANTGDMKRKGALRKSRSLAEESPEDSKKRIKKMPSQGSTKKTAISVESAVEAAGETVVEEVLHKVSSIQDQGDDTSSEASKSTTITSSSSTQQQHTQSSSAELTESTRVVKSELVHAAATIQDAFREHRMIPVDENGKEMINAARGPPTSRTSLQIEPVLEEIAEEVGLDRQASSSRRGSRQDSHGADNEDTSTSESSLSSAATRIQAGFRGHLARRHRLVGGRHGTAGTASTSVSMSMSRDSDAGVVRAMSLLEDSEVQRHQLDTLDQLPEADEFGPAKYVAEVHRVHQEAQDAHKGVEWARSLDSGLSSGPERHTPVRSAVSMQQRALRSRDLDEHIWRTLEQEMQEATDDSGQGEGPGGVRILSRSSHQHRRSLHRGNAMQLPTTSSSTPGSLDEPRLEKERGRELRHTGEFHDVLVPRQVSPDQPQPPPQQQQQPSAGAGRAGFTSSPQLSEAHPSEAPPSPQPPQQEVHEAELPDGATAAAPPPLGGDADDAGPGGAPSSASLPSDMKTAEAAATKIQAGFRGYKVRRQLREQSQDQSLADAGEDGHVTGGSAASNGGQSQHLGQHAGQQQCRSVGAHHEQRDMLESEHGLEGLDEELLQRSAARIQAGVRGFLVRRRQHNAALAAAKIQAGFRGYRARRDLKQRFRLGKSNPTPNRQQQAAL